jgi:hypothetical protein
MIFAGVYFSRRRAAPRQVEGDLRVGADAVDLPAGRPDLRLRAPGGGIAAASLLGPTVFAFFSMSAVLALV